MDFQDNFKDFVDKPERSEKEDLTQKEKNQLQEAIAKSKQSAEKEEEERRYRLQSEDILKRSYKPGTSSEDFFEDESKIMDESPSPKRERKQLKSPIISPDKGFPSKKDVITFQDIPEAPDSTLDIVYHTPVFNLPVTTNPLCQNYNLKKRLALLSDYYTKVDTLRARIAKASKRRAPYPKPITSSDYCTISLSRATIEQGSRNIDKLFEHIPDQQQVYVSRAGRQLKRKVYTEEAEVDSDPDFAYSLKKNKLDDDPDIKLTMDGPFLSPEHHDEVQSSSKTLKTKKDAPKRPPPRKLTSRSEEMFDKLREEEGKRRLQDEERENFERTLPDIDDDDEETLIRDSQEEGGFIRKRVVPPPLAAKKGGRAKKGSREEKRGSESPPTSPVLKRYTNLGKSPPKPKPKPRPLNISEEPSTSSGRVQKTRCPICDREFLQSEIENHASNCGIEEEIDIIESPSRVTRRNVRIVCDVCDQVFLSNIEFHTHTNQCIASKVTDL